eukprot:TRINITY_DN9762_c0_g1_i1.p1 TRINITY_DN9762_c0_g1~~TRINITY_DN9762_c0_g1_i1.p1  ORF type:complete len:203 (-),score=19.77 TRINITY_DN9762_c0_g1_i1:87-695(-)
MFAILRHPRSTPFFSARVITKRTFKMDCYIKPKITTFFHEATNTCTYVIEDPTSKSCAIIDSVLDYDVHKIELGSQFADTIVSYVESNKLNTEWILETHCHADHVTGASYLKKKLGGKIAMSENIKAVQKIFMPVFGLTPEFFKNDGFDVFFKNNENFTIGNLKATVLETPGHTPACVSYLVSDKSKSAFDEDAEGVVFVRS